MTGKNINLVYQGGSSGKEPAFANARDLKDVFNLWVRKIKGQRKACGNPLQHSWLKNLNNGQRSLVLYSPWSGKESDNKDAT